MLLVVRIGVAWAGPPYTRRSSQMQHDSLKPYYEIPDFRLVRIPGVGHSMNVEQPALYAGYFGAWFGGFERRGV